MNITWNVINRLVRLSGLVAASVYAQVALAEDVPESRPAPLHLAAFGDSMTRAFNANGPIDHPWNSWSTGNSDEAGLFRRGQVKSHAEFLGEASGRDVIVHNAARTGATTTDLDRQIESVAKVKITYATMLIGANDLCVAPEQTSLESTFTPDSYQARVEAALTKLISRNPRIKIRVVGIPDMPRLQRLGHDTSCQKRWDAFGFCKNLLRADATQEQLELFTAQWRTANEQLAAIAARHPEHVLFNGSASEYPFEREHISSVDCFHPNIIGQNLISEQTWVNGWWEN